MLRRVSMHTLQYVFDLTLCHRLHKTGTDQDGFKCRFAKAQSLFSRVASRVICQVACLPRHLS